MFPEFESPHQKSAVKEIIESYRRDLSAHRCQIIDWQSVILKNWKSVVYRIIFHFADGTIDTAILKHSHPIYRGGYEIKIYSLLRDMDFLPRLYRFMSDEHQGVYLLLLEDLHGTCLDKLDKRAYLQTARFLGEVHTQLYGRSEKQITWPWLKRLDSELRRIHEIQTFLITQFCEQTHDASVCHRTLQIVERFVPRMQNLVSTLPETFLHGDIHPSNCFYEKDNVRPRLIDWERAMIGPAFNDVAWLAWYAEARGVSSIELLRCYIESVSTRHLPYGNLRENERVLKFFLVQYMIAFIAAIIRNQSQISDAFLNKFFSFVQELNIV